MMKKFFIYFLFCLPLIAAAQKKELTKEDYIARVKANPDSISTLVDLRRVGAIRQNIKNYKAYTTP
ncbi:hypothetical protein [Sphingobacterium sp. IITKGP-BTPF85]|uniref:hypothetical protein n=1 Tax=Sphingobacterium sp. IITKGP-BTPF85 TaxID=1338009 RepID=UPI000389F403|nr:hypothetical protein [Sphingobacterium sp. IITKGP-BTPF85]KKX50688.1 hypothetical protein L950_0209095 [Sphingobacterium sp. IITKGP-BTPF85]